MGRPGLTRHRKFKRAARALDRVQPGFGDILARGALELLWDAAYENGDEFLGEPADVEGVAGWRGEEGLLVEALAGAGGEGHAGFIEEGASPWWPDGAPGTYRVHDLWAHAPDYVQRRAEREAARVAKGKTLSDVRRDAANTRWKKQAAATDMQLTSKCNANGATPAPAPAPAPARIEAGQAGEAPLLPLEKPKARKPADPRHRPFLEALAEELRRARGAGAALDRTKDPPAVSRLLAWSGGDLAEARRRFRAALEAPAPFRCDTIAQLATARVWNHFAPPGAGAPPASLRPLAAPGAR